jgi:hypothetical protein
MTPENDPPPRDLPDRVIRQALHHPANLRAFFRRAVPALADGFDYDRVRFLDREFPLDDWRRREADLPLEIPYRTGVEELLALVVVLIEHQSDADPLMPLRLLYFVVTYWDKQWRDWEQLPRPRPPLRLRPVLPLVLYTGDTSWNTNRAISDLLDEPAAFHIFAPSWQPLFWNLAEQTPEDLLASGEEWLQTLAVLRAQGEPSANFETVFTEALRQLEALHGRDHVRWYDLLRIVLTWAVWRRPRPEQAALLAAAQASQANVARQQEIQTMAHTIAEALIAEGEIKGALRAARTILQRLLTKRFQSLPEDVVKRIEAASDLGVLQACIDRVLEMQSLEELNL